MRDATNHMPSGVPARAWHSSCQYAHRDRQLRCCGRTFGPAPAGIRFSARFSATPSSRTSQKGPLSARPTSILTPRKPSATAGSVRTSSTAAASPSSSTARRSRSAAIFRHKSPDGPGRLVLIVTVTAAPYCRAYGFHPTKLGRGLRLYQRKAGQFYFCKFYFCKFFVVRTIFAPAHTFTWPSSICLTIVSTLTPPPQRPRSLARHRHARCSRDSVGHVIGGHGGRDGVAVRSRGCRAAAGRLPAAVGRHAPVYESALFVAAPEGPASRGHRHRSVRHMVRTHIISSGTYVPAWRHKLARRIQPCATILTPNQ